MRIGSETNWLAIDSGWDANPNGFTVALKRDGRLWSWGYNDGYLLGDGTTASRASPGRIGTANDWATISVGLVHVVAVKRDGTLWVWGKGDSGALGYGHVPMKIGADTGWGDP